MRRWALRCTQVAFAFVSLATLTACRVEGIGKGPSAALLGATAIGAAAVNRSVSGDCWATCSPGWVCNRESGLCEKVEGQDTGLRFIRRLETDAGATDSTADSTLPTAELDAGADTDEASPANDASDD